MNRFYWGKYFPGKYEQDYLDVCCIQLNAAYKLNSLAVRYPFLWYIGCRRQKTECPLRNPKEYFAKLLFWICFTVDQRAMYWSDWLFTYNIIAYVIWNETKCPFQLIFRVQKDTYHATNIANRDFINWSLLKAFTRPPLTANISRCSQHTIT